MRLALAMLFVSSTVWVLSGCGRAAPEPGERSREAPAADEPEPEGGGRTGRRTAHATDDAPELEAQVEAGTEVAREAPAGCPSVRSGSV